MQLEEPNQRSWRAGAERLYFAYGRNMHRAEMAQRCPSAVLQGIARLDRHEFLINARGVATVVPAPRSLVHGVVWDVTPRDEASLDRFEGVALGFYGKGRITVLSDAGEAQAFVYVVEVNSRGPSRLRTDSTLSRNQFWDADQIIGEEIKEEVSGDPMDAAMLGLAHCAVLLAPACRS